MITINSTPIPLIVQLALLAIGIILVGSVLRLLLRLAWRILGLTFTVVILLGGFLLMLQFLHK